MSIEKISTSIAGCFELQPQVLTDDRGAFVKTFHRDWYEQLGLRTDWMEQYYSISTRGVLRGMHFQLPPHDHAKLVFCTEGEVMDVAVDVRRSSPTFGRYVCFTLSAGKGNMVYLAPGLAHGFYTVSDKATMLYNVTSVYSASHDTGIRWDSVGIPWPDRNPRLSERDRSFRTLAQFEGTFDPVRGVPESSR